MKKETPQTTSPGKLTGWFVEGLRFQQLKSYTVSGCASLLSQVYGDIPTLKSRRFNVRTLPYFVGSLTSGRNERHERTADLQPALRLVMLATLRNTVAVD